MPKKHIDESEYYEEHEFSFEDFEHEPSSRWLKQAGIAFVVALACFAILFFALTAFGRTMAGNGMAMIGRSFASAFGISSSGGVSQDVGGIDSADASSSDDVADAASSSGDNVAVASDTPLSDSDFPATLAPVASKSSTKKKTSSSAKKSSAAQSAPVDPADDGSDGQVMDGGVLLAPMSSQAAALSSPAMPRVSVPANSSGVAPKSSATVSAQVYQVSVSLAGDGRGFVSSTPAGIACDGTGTCAWNFPAGSTVTLRAAHDTMSLFAGWSGPCSGTAAVCSFVIRGPVSATANFRASAVAVFTSGQASVPNGGGSSNVISENVPSVVITPSVDNSSSSTPSSDQATSAPPTPDISSTLTNVLGTAPSVDHVVISAVQIAGAASTNDFVRLHNPTFSTVDMSGWKLHKRSNSGADYSVKVFPTGSTVSPGGDFVWANSTDGFSDSIGANVASTQTLSSDNSVGIFDANGTLVDVVAWGTGVGQYFEGSAFPTDPAAGQLLVRKTANDAFVDTDNNADDFQLQ